MRYMNSSVEFDSLFIWNEYRYLEDDFLESVRYLPLVPEHYEVWSAHFADLLIRIGSVFDSFLKRAIFCESLNNIENIDDCRNKDLKNIKITDYFNIFESTYNLSSKFLYELHESETITPFSNWNEITYTPLEWWKAYTSLKHDRFLNRKVATLKVTLDALGGLFLLNILHPETAFFLVDYNIIQSMFAKETIKDIISGKQRASLEPVYAKSNLFGYVYDPANHQFTDEHKRSILSPSYPEHD